jgi:hypothetical protein
MSRSTQRLAAGLTAATIFLLSVGPASAPTGFESSAPSDRASTAEPVTEILVAFSGEAEPSGEGFVVLDPDGIEGSFSFAVTAAAETATKATTPVLGKDLS